MKYAGFFLLFFALVLGAVNGMGETKTACPFRYQGQYEDAETGLYYNRFRYYSPTEGIYISQDPIGLEGGSKLYGYVKDTNNWVDVFGLMKRGPKTKEEGGLHNDRIGQEAQKLRDDGWTITAGGDEQPEKLIKTGGKKDRLPDIIAEKGDKVKVINVGLQDSSGDPKLREQDAKSDLEQVFGKGNVEFVANNDGCTASN